MHDDKTGIKKKKISKFSETWNELTEKIKQWTIEKVNTGWTANSLAVGKLKNTTVSYINNIIPN